VLAASEFSYLGVDTVPPALQCIVCSPTLEELVLSLRCQILEVNYCSLVNFVFGMFAQKIRTSFFCLGFSDCNVFVQIPFFNDNSEESDEVSSPIL